MEESPTPPSDVVVAAAAATVDTTPASDQVATPAAVAETGSTAAATIAAADPTPPTPSSAPVDAVPTAVGTGKASITEVATASKNATDFRDQVEGLRAAIAGLLDDLGGDKAQGVDAQLLTTAGQHLDLAADNLRVVEYHLDQLHTLTLRWAA